MRLTAESAEGRREQKETLCGSLRPSALSAVTNAALLILFFAGTSTAAAPEFIAVAADGSRGQGPIVELNEKGDLTLEGEKPYHVKSGELIELRRVGGSVPKPPSGSQLLLSWGDRIVLDPSSDVKLIAA